MGVSLFEVLKFTAIPVVSTVVAGALAAYRDIGASFRSHVQHFAAGVVFSAAAGEILPDIKREHDPLDLVIGFALGVAAMLVMKAVAKRFGGEHGNASNGEKKDTEHEGDGARSSLSMTVTVAIDVLIDGILIGVAFADAAKTGILLTFALTIELLFLGLSVATTLRKEGVPKGRTLAVIVGIASLLVVGATVGGGLLGGLAGRGRIIVLSFGLAALLFLVVEELLVEAHEVPETTASTASFFVGFLGLTVIEMLT